ncbi:MAG TPA: nuclear transport factor 2 family protein [Ilumatobacter sp.]|nr:nuclear transport factor 2 family protein [Ilumatobacter sp.]
MPPRLHQFLSGAPTTPELFALGAIVAIPDPSDTETAARVIVDPSGGASTVSRPAGRVVLAARHANSLLVEGVRLSGDTTTGTFVASARLGADDTVARYLEFACRGARDPLPCDADEAPHDVPALADIVDRYFHALDEADFSGAADCFSEDVLYSHPPYRHTGIDGHDRVEFRGRSQLLAAFEQRGRTSFDHHVFVYAQHGSHGLIEGRVDGLPAGIFGSFISSVSLDVTGRIRRYVSFYCEPGIET